MYLQDNGLQLDAEGHAFFARELEHIKAKRFDTLYADLQARDLFPVSNEGGSGITSITYQSFDKTGEAKFIGNNAKDLPRADVHGKEITHKVDEIGISYGWTMKEIAASARTGRSLPDQRAKAAHRSVEELVNTTAYFGNQELGLPGFLSNTDIPIETIAADGTGSTTEAANKTPAQVYRDVTGVLNSIFENSKMRERPNTLLVTVALHSYLTETRMADGTDTTILQYLVKNSRFLKSIDDVVPVNELEGAGVGGTDRMVAYTRDPDKIQLEIPAELQYLPAQEQGLEMIVPGWLSISGTVVYYPLSAAFADGL